MLFGFCSDLPPDRAAMLAEEMGDVLTVHERQRFHVWTTPGLVIGQFELPPLGKSEGHGAVRVDAGPYSLWMAGEAFSWGEDDLAGPEQSAESAFRLTLLHALVDRGERVLDSLDGEYQIALWDSRSRQLRLWVDRFAALPVYWTRVRSGVAFAGGVRGLLAVPAASSESDTESIREAVSFGGFRLGSRTNLRDIRMFPPAASCTITADDCRIGRYWTWDQMPAPDGSFVEADALASIRSAWSDAVGRRISGSLRPGLTLSGGLDSRAILAQASRQQGRMQALTYGVAGCDDIRFATRAARTAGASLHVHRLYQDGWLERRTALIHETDGLMELVDLMHLEAVRAMPQMFDVYLSGFGGDVVSGSSYDTVNDAASLLDRLPYYGGRLAMPLDRALSMAEDLLATSRGLPRYCVFDHKYPQAISRITLTARPYVRVRRPFVDYRFFEVAQQVPDDRRRSHAWHEHWLLTTYPEYYRHIPNQRTGSPIGVSNARRQATRVARYAWRRAATVLKGINVPLTVPVRPFHVDEPHWQVPAVRQQIEQTITRSGSICCELFGREAVKATLQDFFTTGQAPLQAIGAMFVFEHYHASLAKSVTTARARVRSAAC